MKYAAVVLIFSSENHVLSISRSGNRFREDVLPGGKLATDNEQPMERLKDTARRTVREKAAVDAWHLVPVFTALARTRITTTFLVTDFNLPDVFPTTRKGKASWQPIRNLCTHWCTYQQYNTRLFKHMGLL